MYKDRGCIIGVSLYFVTDSLCCDRVDLPAMFGAKGIEHAEERVSLVVGDVMQPFPETVQQAAVDTLVMKHFLSAFNDKDATVILKHCSQVLGPQGKILLLQVCLDIGWKSAHFAVLHALCLPNFLCCIVDQCHLLNCGPVSSSQEKYALLAAKLSASTSCICKGA